MATTNLMPDELAERLGARTVSRLVEICGDLMPLYGEDKRASTAPSGPRSAERSRLKPARERALNCTRACQA